MGRRVAPKKKRGPEDSLNAFTSVIWNSTELSMLSFAVVAMTILTTASIFTGGPEYKPAPAGLHERNIVPAVERVIGPSMPQEMYVPHLKLYAKFQTDTCRIKDDWIDPSSLSEACLTLAEGKPYQRPSSNAPDIVVIAGHAGATLPAVFDNLYDVTEDKHTVEVDDLMYLRTQESGEDWLVYRATDLHAPSKGSLPDDPKIWGEDPTPGRLITVTCIQPSNPFAASTKNAVVGWKYEGIIPADRVNLESAPGVEVAPGAAPAPAPGDAPAPVPAPAPGEAPAPAAPATP